MAPKTHRGANVEARHENLPPVDVQLVRLSAAPRRLQSLFQILDPDEIARASRFRFAGLKSAFVQSHAALHILLAQRLGLTPTRICLARDAHNKPHVANSIDLQFNMSHSGSLAAFAFAQDCQVGIDIEERRALPDLDLFVQSHFSAAEQKAFAIVPPALQLQAFFNVWTRKESFRKATGAGLTSALNNFSVSLETNASTSLVAAGRPWQVQPLPIEAGFAAALAYDGPPRAFSQQPPLEMEDLWQSWANPPL